MSRARASSWLMPLRLRPVELHDRADLHGAEPGRRDPGGDLDRVVRVARLDQVEAAELLLGLRERTIGGRGPSVPDPHGRGRAHRLEGVPAEIVAAPPDGIAEAEVFLHEGVRG